MIAYEEFLALFPDRPRNKAGKGWLVICPAHNDHDPSLWVRPSDNPDFIATWDCQAGCQREDVLRALNLTWADVARNGKGGDSTIGKGRLSDLPTEKQIQNGKSESKSSGDSSDLGVTLAQLANAKHLPVDFLRSLGLSDFKLSGLPVVKIPYLTEDGQEVAVRFRQALTGARFKWRKGDHVLPYGLDRLHEVRKAGWVMVVEGESDCWTCWHCGIPAIGIPGKGTWKSEWGSHLKGVEVYVWQEPDAEDFVLRVLASVPDCRFIVAPEDVKDVSEAHIQGLDVPSWLDGLKAGAEYGQVLKTRTNSEQKAATYQAARHIIEAEDPLELVADAIKGLGYGGDLKPVKIVYLAVTSRLLEMRPGAMPVHLLLLGPPSSGKNYTLSRVQMLLPPAATHVIDAGSPRVLIYDDADLQHKVLVFSEADSLPAGEENPAASAIRNLLQDHHLHYVVTVRDPVTGDYTTREVDKPGPTTLITTSTKPLGDQLMTRLFTLQIADTREQIAAALKAQGALETSGISEPDAGLVAFQQFLQLSAPARVIVPFATELSAAMARMATAPRISRDFARLVSLIKATALIRHHHRQINSQGQIVTTLDDYETVRELVNDMYVDTSTGATDDIRRVVQAVIDLHSKRVDGERITQAKVREYLGITQVQASRWTRRATKEGWLVNREQRRGQPADYEPGEPMPETQGLPTLEDMGLTESSESSESSAHDSDSSFENERIITKSPLTDGDISPADDHHAAILGVPSKKAIEEWRSQGAPLIHLGPGENCTDLEKLLSNPNVKPDHLLAVEAWLEKHPAPGNFSAKT